VNLFPACVVETTLRREAWCCLTDTLAELRGHIVLSHEQDSMDSRGFNDIDGGLLRQEYPSKGPC